MNHEASHGAHEANTPCLLLHPHPSTSCCGHSPSGSLPTGFDPPSHFPVQPTWGFGEARVILPKAWGSLGSRPCVPKPMGATVVFSLDGASGWVLANLSSRLEVPRSQNHMERECYPMQSPWLLRAHLGKESFCSVWRRGGFND